MALPDLRLSLQFADPRHKAQLPRHWVTKCVRHALSGPARLTVRFVDEAEGLSLNAAYRQKAYATNVLTFAYECEPEVVADIVICSAVIESEAHAQHKSLQAHYAHMLVHGALHAQGWDHEAESEAQAMESEERAVMSRLGYADPYSV